MKPIMKEECKPSFFPKIPKKGYCMNFFSYAILSLTFRILFSCFIRIHLRKPDVFRNNSSSVLHFILSLHCEEDQEVLDGILPMEPSTGLKRQFLNDSEDAHDVNAPGKIPKKGQ